ncbi:REP-associated tyrosine transposase [Massilia cavernae]|uniref:Transposase n=1 Tax=Massilia cavernae TaxID=2320864 RepID=A0A418XQE9_9BURK|nr:transposase [Massilia cavernae]RJG14678.1 transposase [Massilia cavernae]
MPHHRRQLAAGATYFFTVNLRDRSSGLLVEQVGALREAVRKVRAVRPFLIGAWVVLPEHMHAMWTLPEDDRDYPGPWREIKKAFSRSVQQRDVWQKRYWEHTIRDARDFAAHLDYIHRNPYKHGLVRNVRDWPYSSFHRYVKAGIYLEEWLCDDVDLSAGERGA